jgi:hypothetical protein
MWARYSPNYQAQSHELVEYPPWSWTYVQDYVDITRFDSSSYYKEHGRITKVVLHQSKELDGHPQVAGLELVYGDYPYLIGQREGTSLAMDLANDEVIIRVSAKLLKNHTLASLAFTKARQTIDSQGLARFDKYESIPAPQATDLLRLIPFFLLPEGYKTTGEETEELSHDGEASTPHPTCLLSLCGWFCNDEKYFNKGFGRYIGFFQPVFGCWETIGVDGKSTWAMEDPRGKEH